jgi:hypothetical protein
MPPLAAVSATRLPTGCGGVPHFACMKKEKITRMVGNVALLDKFVARM